MLVGPWRALRGDAARRRRSSSGPRRQRRLRAPGADGAAIALLDARRPAGRGRSAPGTGLVAATALRGRASRCGSSPGPTRPASRRPPPRSTRATLQRPLRRRRRPTAPRRSPLPRGRRRDLPPPRQPAARRARRRAAPPGALALARCRRWSSSTRSCSARSRSRLLAAAAACRRGRAALAARRCARGAARALVIALVNALVMPRRADGPRAARRASPPLGQVDVTLEALRLRRRARRCASLVVVARLRAASPRPSTPTTLLRAVRAASRSARR